MNLEEGTINIKKRFMYKKNTRSKVLIVYTIENKAQDADGRLCKIEYLQQKYLSYRNTMSKERLTVIYHNNKKNAKALYKTSLNISSKIKV